MAQGAMAAGLNLLLPLPIDCDMVPPLRFLLCRVGVLCCRPARFIASDTKTAYLDHVQKTLLMD